MRDGGQASMAVVLGAGAILMVALAWGSLVLRNSAQLSQLQDFESRNALLREENQNLRSNVQYFSSSQFQEKWAKQHLGLLRPGEKLLVIEDAGQAATPSWRSPSAAASSSDKQYSEALLVLPVRQQWAEVFFGNGPNPMLPAPAADLAPQGVLEAPLGESVLIPLPFWAGEGVD